MFKKMILSLMAASLLFLFSSQLMAETDIQTLGCILEPSQKLDVGSAAPGIIASIPVQRGEQVKRKQLLFKLRSGVQEANVSLARVKAEFAIRNKDRNTELYGDELLSSHERDEIETEALVAISELRIAEESLHMRSVQSPVSGMIIEKHYSTGEYVSDESVVEIAVLDPLYVEVLMPYESFRKFAIADQLLIKLAQPLLSEHLAKITIIDPIIDSASGTYRMRLELANKGNSIPAGVPCTIAYPDVEG